MIHSVHGDEFMLYESRPPILVDTTYVLSFTISNEEDFVRVICCGLNPVADDQFHY